MWLSKNILKHKKEKKIKIGSISENQDKKIAITEDIEHKNIKSAAPYGIYYNAPLDENCVIVPVNDEYMCAGVIMGNANLASGDLFLSTSSGSGILIRASGDVEINGNVTINGVKV